MKKIIKIDSSNVQKFAYDMCKFADFNRPSKHCFGMQDLAKEQRALTVNDVLVEAMDKAGFDIQSLTALKENDWKIDDLVSPNKENPVLFINSWFYEIYLDYHHINDYYVEKTDDEILTLPD